jgi:hypothetical protein
MLINIINYYLFKLNNNYITKHKSNYSELNSFQHNKKSTNKIVLLKSLALSKRLPIKSNNCNNIKYSSQYTNDKMLSITGLPYDTLHEVIGIIPNNSSLASFGITYDQIDLIDNDFDYEKIAEYLKNNKVKLIEIQRSKGYSTRKSITIDKVKKVVELIKSIDKDVIIMVDNCYCEFVELETPLTVGADVMVGSLIKNLGGGIAPNGAYIAGRHDLVELAGERLTCPGEGREVGPTLGINKSILQGLFLAPKVVASSLKTAILTSLDEALSFIKILVLGMIAFSFATAAGVLVGKLMCKLTGGKVNPMIGAAGVSAVPMAARVVHKIGLEEDKSNYLLMHAMGPNVAGVIGSAVAAGLLLSILG